MAQTESRISSIATHSELNDTANLSDVCENEVKTESIPYRDDSKGSSCNTSIMKTMPPFPSTGNNSVEYMGVATSTYDDDIVSTGAEWGGRIQDPHDTVGDCSVIDTDKEAGSVGFITRFENNDGVYEDDDDEEEDDELLQTSTEIDLERYLEREDEEDETGRGRGDSAEKQGEEESHSDRNEEMMSDDGGDFDATEGDHSLSEKEEID